jgi:hypothetical protein
MSSKVRNRKTTQRKEGKMKEIPNNNLSTNLGHITMFSTALENFRNLHYITIVPIICWARIFTGKQASASTTYMPKTSLCIEKNIVINIMSILYTR